MDMVDCSHTYVLSFRGSPVASCPSAPASQGNFFQNIGSITLFAVFGTTISAFVVGGGIYFLGQVRKAPLMTLKVFYWRVGQEPPGSVYTPRRTSLLMHVTRASGIEGTIITPRYLVLLANLSLRLECLEVE